jgi:transcriptional regulator
MAFKGDLEALVLGVLEGTEMHGYEISKRIRQLSETALSVGEGQLYPALHRLERDGLVAANWIPQEGKPPRKVYRLTDEGTAALAEHRKEWERFATGVRSILGLRPEGA